jgi:hypothetical protein
MKALREEQLLAGDTDGSVALKVKVGSWTDGKTGNFRALLSSLQDILWDDAGWEPIGVGDLLKPVQVKKAFMKACLIVHPDKITGDEHEKLASLVFDELNKAYNGMCHVLCRWCDSKDQCINGMLLVTAFKESGQQSLA